MRPAWRSRIRTALWRAFRPGSVGQSILGILALLLIALVALGIGYTLILVTALWH